MSTTIDQRVVEMQFDNRHFENNVSTTMSSLEKLKSSLNMSGAAKGFEEIDGAARKVDMSGLGAAVETVRMKFSALQVMGVTALANITNSAVNAGKRIVSSLTIDPIKSGFSEYELKMGSIQTIMASTGESLETVNKYLNELNTYSDKTIYSFSDMTQNIGKFTNAGVKLEDAVLAIQGISNVAAVSGANTNEASRAMYNFAQALSAGHVKLMDWKSIELANMATQEFKTQLLEAAVNAGTLTKTSDGMYKTLQGTTLSATKNFNESLQDQWMTTEVLIGTLKDYSDETTEIGKKAFAAAQDVKTLSQLYDTLKESAQSGWAQTWEIVVGDLEEAKDTLKKINDVISTVIQNSADARNNLLQGWKDAGGRADLVESLFNVIEAVRSVVGPIKEAFHDIFPPLTVERLVSFTKGIKDFTARLKLGSTAANNLKRTFKGVFAILDVGKQILSAAFNTIKSLFGSTTDLGGGILELTASFGDFLVRVNETIKKSGIITKVFSVIGAAVKLALGVINTFIGLITGKFASASEACSAFGESFTSAFDSLGAAVKDSPIVRIFSGIWNVIKTVATAIIAIVGSVADTITSKLGSGDLTGVLDILNGLVAGGLGVALIKLINKIKELKNPFGGITEIFENVSGMFEELGGAIKSFTAGIKSKILMNIAIAIGILAASLMVLSLIDSDKLYDSIIAIAALFAGLMGSLSFMAKGLGKTKGLVKLALTMMGIAAAVLILAFALKTIGGLEPDRMASGLLGVAGLLTMVILTMKSLDGTKALKGATQMVILAAAVKILASACIDLASLNLEELSTGLSGVGILLMEIMFFLNAVKTDGKMLSTAIGVVVIAAAVKILASACEDFAYLSTGELIRGLSAIAATLAAITLFTKTTGNAKQVITTGIAMIAIAAAMKIFASATKDMASMTWGDLTKGLLGMAGSLAILAVAFKVMPKNLAGSAVSLVIISSALVILAEALGRMGGMSWGGVAKSLVALGGSLGVIAIGLMAMKSSVSGSAALVIAAGALAILAPVLVKMGNMTWGNIAKGLIAIAGAFTIIGVAGYLLTPVVPTLLGLAGAFALIGLSVTLVGVGLLAAGAGLAAVGAGISALAGSLVVVASSIVSIVSSIVVGLIRGLGEGIIALCKVISDGAPAIGAAIKALILTACDILVECVPVLANSLLKLIVGLLDALVEFTPRIVDAIFNFILCILESLGKNIPRLVKGLVEFFMDAFSGVADALGGLDLATMLEGIKCIGLMSGVMIALAALSALAPAAMLGVLAFGAVIAELAIVLAAVGTLALIPGLTWLVGKGGDLLEAIGTTIGRFIGGIAGGIAQGFTSSLPEMASDLSSFMRRLQPFIDGARMIDEFVVNGVQSLVKMVLAITAADVIQSIASWITGSSSIGTFASELPALGRGLKAFSDEVAGINTENIVAASKAARVLADMTSVIPNEGGVVGWFVGENSISKFGDELPALGRGLKGFSDSVAGISPENIVAAAEAAKVLSDMTSTIPNEGGVVAWFTGENSITRFADDIVELGKGLKGFSDEVAGTVPANITAAAEAAKNLAQMTTYIPNEGGVVAWFTGENSITRFADDIVTLGFGLRGFAFAVTGIVPEAVTAGAAAAQALAQMTTYIPNQGGVVAWFTGEASISKFANQLPNLGKGLKGFSEAVAGTDGAAMSAAANAAKTLAEMTNTLPNQGGVVAWFTGETSISKFGGELGALGRGLKGFGTATEGLTPDKITAAAGAAKALAEMTTYIPNQGGVVAWFTGETSIANFASKLPMLGMGLKGFSMAVEGINGENMIAAANAAKSLAQMTAIIPTEGGIKAWFTGETSVANFADKLPGLGKGLKGFSNEVADINGENVTAATTAAKSLAEMTNIVPKNTDKIVKFGTNLASFGEKLKSYFTKTSGITAESVSSVTSVIDVVERVSTLESGNVKSVAKAIEDIGKSLKSLAKIPKNSTSEFKKAMNDLGKESADKLVKALESAKKGTETAGKDAMNAFIKGVKSVSSDAKKACTAIADACADAIGEASSDFSSAGADLVDGFASGISSNSYKAAAKARAMAQAAAKAAKEELDINSPSKVFRAIGTSVPEGFAMGIDKFTGVVKTSSTSMADTAIGTVSKSISMLADMINTDIDSQPTIRPVLDLSDIKSGARSLSGLLGMGSSIGVSANIGAISSMMSARAQNGNNDDVVSAINKLGKGLAERGGDTYNIGVNDNDDIAVQEAVKIIVRAARIGGRV